MERKFIRNVIHVIMSRIYCDPHIWHAMLWQLRMKVNSDLFGNTTDEHNILPQHSQTSLNSNHEIRPVWTYVNIFLFSFFGWGFFFFNLYNCLCTWNKTHLNWYCKDANINQLFSLLTHCTSKIIFFCKEKGWPSIPIPISMLLSS